jgi:hypothetical protein
MGAAYALVCAWALAAWSIPQSARAEFQVKFEPLTDGPEFADAMEFFARRFTPDEYDTERRLAGSVRRWKKLGTTLDLYLREFVKVGRADVDGDGVDERIYILDDPGWCGTAGCTTFIVGRSGGVVRTYCEVGGNEKYFRITDRSRFMATARLNRYSPSFGRAIDASRTIPKSVISPI